MDNKENTKADSKLLSLILRHKPEKAGLTLDEGGWVDVEKLMTGLAEIGRPMSRDRLEHIVETNDKKRFTLSEGGLRIRAAQGHSTTVKMEYVAIAPPTTLYHGTADRHYSAILAEGLKPMSRQFVHLSAETDTAQKVGRRHGKPIIFEVATREMHNAGHEFHQAENGVWLTANVPPEFLRLIE